MVGGKLEAARIAAGVLATQGPPLRHHGTEHSRNRLAGLDPVRDFAAIGDEPAHRLIGRIDNAEGDVRCTEQVARRRAHALQHSIGIARRGDLEPDVEQGAETGVGASQVLGLLRGAVEQQPQMLAAERRGREGFVRRVLRSREHATDDLEHFLRPRGLGQDIGHAGRAGHFPRFPFTVGRGVEQHGDSGSRGVETKLPDEVEAVHHRHEHVGDDQIRVVGPDGGKSLPAVRGLEEPVSLIAQQRYERPPVGRQVVDDEDGRHYLQNGRYTLWRTIHHMDWTGAPSLDLAPGGPEVERGMVGVGGRQASGPAPSGPGGGRSPPRDSKAYCGARVDRKVPVTTESPAAVL